MKTPVGRECRGAIGTFFDHRHIITHEYVALLMEPERLDDQPLVGILGLNLFPFHGYLLALCLGGWPAGRLGCLAPLVSAVVVGMMCRYWRSGDGLDDPRHDPFAGSVLQNVERRRWREDGNPAGRVKAVADPVCLATLQR
ncbi:MAG: hypothetical protein WBJ41_00510 [Chromatiaceae bacterium]